MSPAAVDTLFGAEQPTARRRVERDPTGRPTRPSGYATFERAKAWVANPRKLTMFDVAEGLSRRLGELVTVDAMSSDPDEPIVVGTCRRQPFSIRALPGEDLGAVLTRLTEQLKRGAR